jgi:ATP-binding cassette subfamily B protein
MGLAFERPFIFRGTVAENLLFGIRRALPENVMDVTEKLGSHDFIENLEKGYETQLSEGATLLSNSQKQAINVARLVLQNNDLAIYDEALSAADTVTEKSVYETIMKTGRHQTKIFITHRLSSVEKCDMIYYMEHGRILETGTHAELMALGKKYYKAYIGD